MKKSLEHQQKILELQLSIARERFQHHGLRGGAAESALRAFIESNLPRTFSVGTGEVIATSGDKVARTSRQIDVVISNEMQPFSASRDDATVLLIEGVNAAGEVKSTLNRSGFVNEMKKGKTFRSLRAQNLSRLVSVPKPDVWESYYVHYRPYFIFTYETTGDWRRFLIDTADFIVEHKKIPYDALFLMDKGIVVLISPFLKFPFSKFAGTTFFHENVDLGRIMGGIHIYKTTAFLAFFLSWLSVFRSSFFSNKSALPYYLETVVNESLEDIILATSKDGDQMKFVRKAMAGADSDRLKSLADFLREDLEGN